MRSVIMRFSLRSPWSQLGLVLLGVASVGAPVRGDDPPPQPVYRMTFEDAVTGKNRFKASDGKFYWTVDPGADAYQHDTYERPTAAGYKVIDGKYATAEYLAYLDIVRARAGYDDRFIYVAIKMYGLDRMTSDGGSTRVGLTARYGFRFSKDPDGRNGILVVADRPEQKD